MQEQNIEYLIEQLSATESNYCTEFFVPIKDFKIKFNHVGQLAIPLSEKQIYQMLKFGHPAPFGWRDQTIMNKSVRDCWEISPDHFSISPSWNKVLSKNLQFVEIALGLTNANLVPELYKMLVYEKEHFFLPHQDTEKLDGMVATLIVVVPSDHKGGDIIICHHDKTTTFRTDQKKENIQCIAFYADCHHEVKPILSGQRVVLTYNLILKRENSKEIINTPNQFKLEDQISKWFQNYFSTTSYDSEMFVYLFDHQYTSASIQIDLLKGNDYKRAKSLVKIAQNNNYQAYLGLADIHETWSCESDYSYSRGQFIPQEEQDYFLEDLIEDQVQLRNLKSLGPDNTYLETIDLNNSEIFMTMATDKLKPFFTEFEGWMGNYGNTLDRWYHRACIIIWPIKNNFIINFKNNSSAMVQELYLDLRNKYNHDKTKDALKLILENIETYKLSKLVNNSIDLLNILNTLEDEYLNTEYLKLYSLENLNEDHFEIIVNIANNMTRSWQEKFLLAWFENSIDKLRWQDLNFCGQYTSSLKELNNLSLLFEKIFHLKLSRDKFLLNKALDTEIPNSIKDIENKIPQEIVHIIETSIALSIEINIVELIFNQENLFWPVLQFKIFQHLTSSPIILKYSKIDFKKLSIFLIRQIKKEIIKMERKTDDWSIDVNLKCSCEDCKLLTNFLNSKDLQITKIALNKDRRMHLHQKIDRYQLDVSHVTIRSGSPYTLELKKQTSLFSKNKIKLEGLNQAISFLNILN